MTLKSRCLLRSVRYDTEVRVLTEITKISQGLAEISENLLYLLT